MRGKLLAAFILVIALVQVSAWKAPLSLQSTQTHSNMLKASSKSQHLMRHYVAVDQLDVKPVVAKVRKGSTPDFVIEGDSIENTPFQVSIVTAHFLLMACNIIAAIHTIGSVSALSIVGSLFALVASIVLGDLGTGVFHWAVDNYGSIDTPIFGKICVAFQGHHQSPWTITFRPFANNVYKIAIATVPCMIALLATTSVINPYLQFFLAFFINWWLMSQELHKYSHMKQPPAFVKFLQDKNLILSRKEHGLHHLAPFEGHYCIVTGMGNPLLDKTNFFRHLEKAVYRLTGNEPITWKEDPKMKDLAMSSEIIP